jgi:hypothetical protein
MIPNQQMHIVCKSILYTRYTGCCMFQPLVWASLGRHTTKDRYIKTLQTFLNHCTDIKYQILEIVHGLKCTLKIMILLVCCRTAGQHIGLLGINLMLNVHPRMLRAGSVNCNSLQLQLWFTSTTTKGYTCTCSIVCPSSTYTPDEPIWTQITYMLQLYIAIHNANTVYHLTVMNKMQ